MATPSMQLIKAISVGVGGAANIDFTAIPQTGFTDLQLVYSLRDTSAAVFNNVFVTLNNSTTGYSDKILYSYYTAGPLTTGNSNTNQFAFNYAAGSQATASTFGSGQIYIPNYAGNINKSISVDSVTENAATQAFGSISAGLWANTAAITSIKLTPGASATFVEGSTAYLYGITKWAAPSAKATGGTIKFGLDGYTYHTFTASGTFTPTTAMAADVLVIAGGGAGGSRYGAGGGAGGVLYQSAVNFNASGYPVVIGAGGAASYQSGPRNSGANSTISTLTAIGGGGAGNESIQPGLSGGSGGGGAGGGGTAGAGTAGQGYAGGASTVGYGAAGGGGAGAVGGVPFYGPGGDGTNAYANWAAVTGTGVNGYYAGGGGGENYNGSTNVFNGGGAGGGGAASYDPGNSGVANTGSGGGGAHVTTGGGGSGLVIVRYAS